MHLYCAKCGEQILVNIVKHWWQEHKFLLQGGKK